MASAPWFGGRNMALGIENASAADEDAEGRGIACLAMEEIHYCQLDLRLLGTARRPAVHLGLDRTHTRCSVQDRPMEMDRTLARDRRVAASWLGLPATWRARKGQSR